MPYLMPIESIFKVAGLKYSPGEMVHLPWKDLCQIISNLLIAVEVDEEWYKQTYPDVAQAIASGTEKSAKQHFITSGYFEGRLPKKITVDEAFYCATYPDVATGIEEGFFDSAQEHFDQAGVKEGRLPFAVDRQPSRTSTAAAEGFRRPGATIYRRAESTFMPPGRAER